MNKDEALKLAEELKQKKDSYGLIELLEPFYAQRKTIDVACYLIYAYRRNKDFKQCYKICDEMDKEAGKPGRIKAQRKWTMVFEEVIYEDDTNTKLENAALIFKELDQSNAYDFFLAKFIFFHVVDNCKQKMPDKAIEWFQKLEAHRLDNKKRYFIREDEGSYEIPDRKYHSEKYIYYNLLSELLINHRKLDDWLMNLLKPYSNHAKASFFDAIKKKISSPSDRIIYWLLRKILMALSEDKYVMQKAANTNIKDLISSDVSSYVYCPASAAIKKSIFPIPDIHAMDYDDEAQFRRKRLNDLYEVSNNSKQSADEIFSNLLVDGFSFADAQKKIINRIFKAVRIGQNVNHNTFLNYYFENDFISGSPDMYLKDSEEFLVEEVYTQTSVSSLNEPRESDTIKLIGYLQEMNIRVGYLFYWNTKFVSTAYDRTRISKISGLKIFTVTKTEKLVAQYYHAKKKMQSLLSSKSAQFNASQINYHKCVSCSVIFYCIHKRGLLNDIALPYKENYER